MALFRPPKAIAHHTRRARLRKYFYSSKSRVDITIGTFSNLVRPSWRFPHFSRFGAIAITQTFIELRF